ncbi:MAG: hypothetical protein F4Y80_07355 [Caldilineaceae bacterium SB0665_bin_21]|nr:hypothetical protein [Caldilineaceae bacterium SB0665_bin_21]MYA03412.1 hypothetical protein [Caldilineaceae bacterium SB0664_bin_22]MYC62691.1 hypothetical protein [Caldilineaceae bacterium SB0661_bin_34]
MTGCQSVSESDRSFDSSGPVLRRLPHRLPWIAEDHVHDPSRLVVMDGRLTLYASGTRGNGLDRHMLKPETGRFERDEPAFSRCGSCCRSF